MPSENETDPNILFTKRDRLLNYFVFTIEQADRAYSLINESTSHSGELTSLFAQAKEKYNKLEKDRKKLFLAEISKFVKLFYYVSIVYNIWNNNMKRFAVFLDALYNVLYEKSDNARINPGELVELVEYSAKKASEEEDLLVNVVDYSLERVSTESYVKEESYSLIDEIIYRINARYGNYENAHQELVEIVNTLSSDNEMIINVRDSSPSAYEAEAMDKIGQIFVNGILSATEARSQFYAQIGSDKDVIRSLAKAVIRRIQDELKAG